MKLTHNTALRALSLEKNVLEEIEQRRGQNSRSRFVNDILKKNLFSEGE